MNGTSTHLVLRKFGLFPSTDDGEVVGLAEHDGYADARAEVCRHDIGEHVDRSREGGGGAVACRTIPLDTLSSHGLALKTIKAFSSQPCGSFR